jgi:hypothetical protein
MRIAARGFTSSMLQVILIWHELCSCVASAYLHLYREQPFNQREGSCIASSDRISLAEATGELFNVAMHPQMKNKTLFLVFNKSDLPAVIPERCVCVCVCVFLCEFARVHACACVNV